MITATEVVENYKYFDVFMHSLPVDPESQTQIPALCADLDIDSNTTLELTTNLRMSFTEAAMFFHGFVYAIWLMREKKGL